MIWISIPIAFLAGSYAGFRLFCWAFKCGLAEGHVDRKTMAKLVATWRGPNGETWAEKTPD